MDWTVSSQSDLVERGYDEDGTVMLEVHYLTATNARGDRFVGPTILSHRAGFADTYAANVAAEVEKFKAEHPNFDPTTAENWDKGSPVYGSEAWDGEAEFDLACFEADAYNEPRPNWF